MWHPLQLECPECGKPLQIAEVLVQLPLTIRIQGPCNACEGDVIVDLNPDMLTLLVETGECNQRILQQYEAQLSEPEQDGA